jgi:transposase
MEKRQQIQALTALNWSARRISRETGIDRRTVLRYRREGVPAALEEPGSMEQNAPQVPTDPQASPEQNVPEVPADIPPPPPTNSAQIQPHADSIRVSFLRHLTAQRIYQDLVEEHGFRGSYDSVKRYVRKLRRRHRRYAERLPHLPGREAQVDFGKSPCYVRVNGRYRRVWVFKMTLSCSKHAYEELVLRQDVETFIRCHERAFLFFGGVPEIVTLDNLKSGVLLASLYDPELNPAYLAFATHWGFAANPCIPRKPEHKGVVEKDVGYTKNNALKGRRFESIDEANVFLRHWNKRWARSRIHGSTKVQVWRMFCEIERGALRPVADKEFEYFQVVKRKVDVNGLVEVDARYYQAPHQYVGETLVVHHNSQWVSLLYGNEVVIRHQRLEQRGRVSKSDACLPPWKHPNLESQERYYCSKARAIGPNFYTLVYAILCSNDPLAIRRARGMMSLARKYPAQVEAASEYARWSKHKAYQRVKEQCERLLSKAPVCEPSPLTQHHELIRPLAHYDDHVNERTLP